MDMSIGSMSVKYKFLMDYDDVDFLLPSADDLRSAKMVDDLCRVKSDYNFFF